MSDPIESSTREAQLHLRNIQQVLALLIRRRAEQQRMLAAIAAEQARAIEHRRRVELDLARPVYQMANQDRFWQAATLDDAVLVYSLADQFADIDPQASLAKQRAERELEQRWNFDPEQAIAQQALQAEASDPPQSESPSPRNAPTSVDVAALAAAAVTSTNDELATSQKQMFIADLLAQAEAIDPDVFQRYSQAVAGDSPTQAQPGAQAQQPQAEVAAPETIFRRHGEEWLAHGPNLAVGEDVEITKRDGTTVIARVDELVSASELEFPVAEGHQTARVSTYDSKERRSEMFATVAAAEGNEFATAVTVTDTGRSQPVASTVTTSANTPTKAPAPEIANAPELSR